MKTKVSNCGKYECTHCSHEEKCLLQSISIDKEGKCVQFSLPKNFGPGNDESLEHTNMC